MFKVEVYTSPSNSEQLVFRKENALPILVGEGFLFSYRDGTLSEVPSNTALKITSLCQKQLILCTKIAYQKCRIEEPKGFKVRLWHI